MILNRTTKQNTSNTNEAQRNTHDPKLFWKYHTTIQTFSLHNTIMKFVNMLTVTALIATLFVDPSESKGLRKLEDEKVAVGFGPNPLEAY